MTKICELLDRDPRTARLANNGQARITDTSEEGARAELRAELESFVCDGQFGDALQRILDRYLANLGTPRQESAWVSGFFGSGKSHLLKMLGHLWVNTEFEDGATARALVRGLPDDLASVFEWHHATAHARRLLGHRPFPVVHGAGVVGTLAEARDRVRDALRDL